MRTARGIYDPAVTIQELQRICSELGFCKMGICHAAPFRRGERALKKWLEAGYHGEMEYLDGVDRSDPSSVFPNSRSILVVALPYGRPEANVPSVTGRIAAYARGTDYHSVLKEKLRRLADRINVESDGRLNARACVDTAPILEREAAERAGVGFIAKSTMMIAPGRGSYVLIGELLLDGLLPLTNSAQPKCGSCRACLDACPTGAFVDAHVLDARRCISYLTIEYRGWIPKDIRPLMGNWIFGCDICQMVCPFNASKQHRPITPELKARDALPSLVDVLELGSSAYRRLVAKSALRRAPRWQLQRNAAVALGNSSSSDAIRPLERALSDNRYPIVRGHAAWALGQLGSERLLTSHDPHARVQDEILSARARVAERYQSNSTTTGA